MFNGGDDSHHYLVCDQCSFNERRGSTFTRCAFCTGGGVEQPTSTISAIAGKKAFIIIKLPSGLQVSLIIYIGIVADILRISLSLYKL